MGNICVFVKSGMVGLLVAMLSFPRPAWSEEVAPQPEAAAPAPSVPAESNEAQWQKDIKKARSDRNALYAGSAVGAVGGIALMAMGFSQTSKAEDVNGCERTGTFEITCMTEAGRREAQDKLDSGRTQLLAGLGVGAVGFVLFIFGRKKSNRVRNLEFEGEQKRFQMVVQPRQDNGITVAGRLRF